jgi:hypothetical protein
MRPSPSASPKRARALFLLAAAAVVMAIPWRAEGPRPPAATRALAQMDEAVLIHLPVAGKNLLRPWSRPVPLPSATPTPLSEIPPPEFTPEPTRDTRRAAWPRDADTIVLQLGRSETSQPGEAWEEMNGTPYLTLYGDGRLIASRYLFGFDQTLYETRLDEEQMQTLLVPLHFDIDVFRLRSLYSHPRNSQFVGHLFLRFGQGESEFKQVRVTGMTRWRREDLPPDGVEDGERIKQLVDWMYALEDDLTVALDEPFAVERYTIIAHEVLPSGNAPAWPLALDIKAISDSAPLRTAEGNVHGPPGHRFVDGEQGDPIREATARDAKANHPGQNFAAAYTTRGTSNHVVVGARSEVPGGTLFLPDRVYDRWYREDGGG